VIKQSKQNELVNDRKRQIGIILLDFFNRRAKLGVLNDRIRENAGTAYYGAARHLSGYPFDQLAADPVDITIRGCHFDPFPTTFYRTGQPRPRSYCNVLYGRQPPPETFQHDMLVADQQDAMRPAALE